MGLHIYLIIFEQKRANVGLAKVSGLNCCKYLRVQNSCFNEHKCLDPNLDKK